jgi:hypothetical protein
MHVSRFEARHGTPHHLDVKSYTQPSLAKKFLVGKMKDREEWASKFNLEAQRRLAAAREEFDGLDIAKLKVGDRRRWEVADEHTGVVFVFVVEKMEE